jgi:hypothetical protein
LRLEIEINRRKRDADASRTNGLKGGRPKGKKPNHNLAVNLNKTQTKPKPNLTENENVIENEDINVSENEVIDYFQKNNFKIEAAKKFFAYYSASDWKDSRGKKVRNWRLKAQSVWFTEENKQPEIRKKEIKPSNYWDEESYLKACKENGVEPQSYYA